MTRTRRRATISPIMCLVVWSSCYVTLCVGNVQKYLKSLRLVTATGNSSTMARGATTTSTAQRAKGPTKTGTVHTCTGEDSRYITGFLTGNVIQQVAPGGGEGFTWGLTAPCCGAPRASRPRGRVLTSPDGIAPRALTPHPSGTHTALLYLKSQPRQFLCAHRVPFC